MFRFSGSCFLGDSLNTSGAAAASDVSTDVLNSGRVRLNSSALDNGEVPGPEFPVDSINSPTTTGR